MRKTTCASTGHEGILADRIKEINSIIKKNSTAPIKDVVKKIAKVSMGAWYNYFSKGGLRGKISNTTVAAMKDFFGIPEDVFAGKGEFTPEHQKAVADKIKEVFGNVPKAKRGPKANKAVVAKVKAAKKPTKATKAKKVKVLKAKKAKPERVKKIKAAKPMKAKAGRPRKIKEPVEKTSLKVSGAIEGGLKGFATQIDSIKDLKHIKGLSEMFTKLSNIVNKKMELLTALNSL